MNIFVSGADGSDVTGDGTAERPFQTPEKAETFVAERYWNDQVTDLPWTVDAVGSTLVVTGAAAKRSLAYRRGVTTGCPTSE